MIDFRILGRMELSGSGSAASDPAALLSQPKPTALFVYLLLDRPGALQRRDRLAAMLWPESDQKRARGALSQTLYVIRRHLGSDVLVTRGTEDVGIAADRVRCDALEFQRMLAAGERERALALYAGDLLPSFYLSDAPAFEHWLATEQAKARRAARDAAWVLAEEAESEGDVPGAGRWARWAARVDPHDEATLRRMMEMLDRIGDRSGALAEFDRYRKRLLSELELEPESDTSELAALLASAGRRGEGPAVPARAPLAATGLAGDAPGQESHAPRRTLRRIGSAFVAFALLVAALATLERLFTTPSPEPASGEVVPAIAVMPVPGDSALTEQVTRHLIDLLQRAGLRTQSWLSVKRYLDTVATIEVLRERHGVAYVVEVEATETAAGAALSLSLVDTQDGFGVWRPETFSGSLRQLSDYEYRTALAIAGRVAERERQDPEHYRIQRYTQSAVADSFYLSAARLMSDTYNGDSLQRAADDLRSAIAADSGFALARVKLADALLQQTRNYWTAPPAEQAKEVLELLGDARALAPDLPGTYTALGWYYYAFKRDYETAIRNYQTAINRAPYDPLAYTGYAFPLIATGRVDSALAVVRHARDLERMNPLVASTQCWFEYLADRLEDALRTCTFVTDSIDPAYDVALDIENLVSTLLMVRHGDTAGLSRMRSAFEADPSSIGEQELNFEHGVAFYWAAVGDTARALATLEAEKTRPDVRPLRIANGYATIGMMDSAFVWLDRAIEQGDPFLPEITVRPVMEPFRRDPRYAEVLRELGLDRYFPEVR